MKETKNKRANHTEKKLKQLAYRSRKEIGEIECFLTPDFLRPEDISEKDLMPCNTGFSWDRDRSKEKEERLRADLDLVSGGELADEASLGNNAWFRLRFPEPDSASYCAPALHFSVKGKSASSMSPVEGKPSVEALCYKGGRPWAGLDHGHDLIYLTEPPERGDEYQLLLEVGTTLLWGGLDVESFYLEAAEIIEVNEEVRSLYFEYSTFNHLIKELTDSSPLKQKILSTLTKASHKFPFGAEEGSRLARGAAEAREVLQSLKKLKSDFSDFTLSTIGHAHVDAAWLWPWTETVRKCGRTFSTADKLMKDNEDFAFLQSQPHLYQFVKNRYPELFDQAKKRVEEGKWEPVGATWVESDVNLSGGEALARQYLYGKRYFRNEFGIDPKITFIPDVFGYSASLPGIARSADCPYFFTQKMSWNEVNDFPHHTFLWEGIDGSELLAHFPPADTYNGMSTGDSVKEVMKSVRDFKETDQLDRAGYLIGWGDGGGGVNQEMIERVRVIDEVDSLPDLEFGNLKELFEELDQGRDKLDRWTGELYLERHRGTLTTQGKTKLMNRKLEFALREAEIWSATALLQSKDASYPKEELKRNWKVLLFHQFHDILPGSSIGEVYVDAERDYGKAFHSVYSLVDEAQGEITETEEGSNIFMVFNSLSWNMDRPVELNKPEDLSSNTATVIDDRGTELPGQVTGENEEKLVFNAPSLPPMGGRSYKVLARNPAGNNAISVSTSRMENSLIEIEMGKKGYISSITDKEAQREVLSGPGNHLLAYRDLPTEFEAWELEGDIYDLSEELPEPAETEVLEHGPVRGGLRQKRYFGNSRVTQEIFIYSESKRIDFETSVEWAEKNTLLKAHFPVKVLTREATYEIQYGHYSRPTHSNTSWDEARFEVPHQKWVNVSEYGYGAAVLNDSKYGVNVDGSNIGLSLLRAPESPDPEADIGRHRFTYSLLPHSGDFRDGGVIKQAYDLNSKTRTQPVKDFETIDPLARIEDEGVIIEAIKRAEDVEDAVVIRAYEAWGRSTKADLKLNFSPERVVEVNLIEDEKEELVSEERKVELEFSKFEIKSLKINY